MAEIQAEVQMVLIVVGLPITLTILAVLMIRLLVIKAEAILETEDSTQIAPKEKPKRQQMPRQQTLQN